MKLVYLLLIFGIIYSITVPNYVFDIYYNVEYKLSQDLYREFTYYPLDFQLLQMIKWMLKLKYPIILSMIFNSQFMSIIIILMIMKYWVIIKVFLEVFLLMAIVQQGNILFIIKHFKWVWMLLQARTFQ